MRADPRPCTDLFRFQTLCHTQEKTLASGACPGPEGEGTRSRVCREAWEAAGCASPGNKTLRAEWEGGGAASRLPAAAFAWLGACRPRTGVGLPHTAPEGPRGPDVTEKLAGHTQEGDCCLLRAAFKVDSGVFKERRGAPLKHEETETTASDAQVVLFRF